MSERARVLEKVQGMLSEEKWTRASINNYTVADLKALDLVKKEVEEVDAVEETAQECSQHLQHDKNSVTALYLSATLALGRQLADDTHFLTLVKIFSGANKWGVVEFVANQMLVHQESRVALRALIDCYESEGDEKKKIQIWERLIRVDYQEADIVKKLAMQREQEGQIEEAVAFYKKAMYRYISKGSFSAIREIWNKLLEINEEDREFFSLIENKVLRAMGSEQTVQLLSEEFSVFLREQKWDSAIVILKRILTHEPQNAKARREIINAYRKKYENHKHLEEYLKLSNLSQSWRNPTDAIADFEKHIFFEAGSFVFHKSWGIGVIRRIEDGNALIDFTKKRGHLMSLKMAVSALQNLEKDHIWVLKGIMKKEELREKVQKEPIWVLKSIIRSFHNEADMKMIKAELVPSVLTPKEWTSWGSEAKKILKNNAIFGNLPDKQERYVVRDKPISPEEKLFNEFKAAKSFFGRARIVREFLERFDPDSDYFAEMFQFFRIFLKTTGVTDQVIASFLFIQELSQRFPFLQQETMASFKELYDLLEFPQQTYAAMADLDLRRSFLKEIRKTYPEWPQIYKQIFPEAPCLEVIEELMQEGEQEVVQQIMRGIMQTYRERREAFVWMVSQVMSGPLGATLDLSYERLLLNMIDLLALTFRDITNKREAPVNRKVNKAIQNYLFKENRLKNFLLEDNQEAASRIVPLLMEIPEVDPSWKMDLEEAVKKCYPKIKYMGQKQETLVTARTSSPKVIFTTQESLRKKQQKLKHILEVEIPKNSKEIGAAIELGDLKENAEYKAGREKQESLNIQVGRLKEEIKNAKVFDLSQIDGATISFGTSLSLKNLNTGEQESYSILGPWESDPDRNIISYLSPFGSQLVGHISGDTLQFAFNERDLAYEVLKVEPMKMDQ